MVTHLVAKEDLATLNVKTIYGMAPIHGAIHSGSRECLAALMASRHPLDLELPEFRTSEEVERYQNLYISQQGENQLLTN